jgi:predicted flavoprotein YhiN
VDLKGVEPDTLQSRTLEGLFLAGEMLDLDGPSGGFNLQWAFASGWLAGKSAARP